MGVDVDKSCHCGTNMEVEGSDKEEDENERNV